MILYEKYLLKTFTKVVIHFDATTASEMTSVLNFIERYFDTGFNWFSFYIYFIGKFKAYDKINLTNYFF